MSARNLRVVRPGEAPPPPQPEMTPAEAAWKNVCAARDAFNDAERLCTQHPSLQRGRDVDLALSYWAHLHHEFWRIAVAETKGGA